MNGRNISRTFGYMPRLTLRMVPNYYSRPVLHKQAAGRLQRKRQIMNQTTNQFGVPLTTPVSFYGQPGQPGQQSSTVSSFYAQNYYGQPTQTPLNSMNSMGVMNQMNPMGPGSLNPNNPGYNGVMGINTNLSIYDQYNQAGNTINVPYDGPNISPKLPQDEVYFKLNIKIKFNY
jgi:hypothetical protein